jgi:hypothetical protein
MAHSRVGAGASRGLAAQPTVDSALSSLQESGYAERLRGAAGLAAAERAVQETVLWQLRVLAGWLPASGTALARAAAGTFEIENIMALAHRLTGGAATSEPYQLGALATAWPRLATAGSREELADALSVTAWGADVGAAARGGTAAATQTTAGTGALRDALTVVWARRLAGVAAPARPWCGALCVLTAARILTVDGGAPPAPAVHLLRPVLGTAWENTRSLAEFTAALPRSLQPALQGVASPKELWRAEARLHAAVEKDGFQLLRGSMPGPDVVLGAIAVLSTDAWRVRAALTAAAAGSGSSEVLDAAA